ncbi:antirestriction protein ArdA [Vibrio vulnificus]|uniref:antirestriction protein ArdA n=1 Tax=Vibrio vulnificus TaxID=672 RepID=UPI001A20452A|nr:antirestriction protein ArdA [Vibrio vulnificus]MCA0766301.1 antirestriction protein ArdA [Vibrio vulnificus]HAT8542839.1 antirestriction protein [Vibrio vulnificus]
MKTSEIIKALETSAKAMNESTICIRFYGLADGWDIWLDAQEIVEIYSKDLAEWISEALQNETGLDVLAADKEAANILNRDWCVVDDEGGLVGCFISYANGWGFMDWDGYEEALESDLDTALVIAALENGIQVSEISERYYGEFTVSICQFMQNAESTAFAELYAEEIGLLSEMPENLKQYFDFERYGRDLAMDFTFIDSGRVENCERVYYAFHN